MTLSSSHHRVVRKLYEAFGSTILRALDDTTVVEIMLNPDGRLFVERLGGPMTEAGTLAPQAAEIIIGTVAHILGTQIDLDRPIISGELPIGGHRFEGLLAPVVVSPSFTIRKRVTRLIPLDDYVRDGTVTECQASLLRRAIAARMNIVVAGGAGSGKTTLANALIAEVVRTNPDHRLVILEDTAELRSTAQNCVALHTSDAADMSRLLKSTLRLRPDRIVVGEVRDGAALTLLKAWNTGHPGGIATLHANSARSALTRLQQLAAEVSVTPVPEIIAEAVDLVVAIERYPGGRRVREVLRVNGYHDGQYDVQPHNNEGSLRNVA
jgi:type IV secretion system protein VirB11